MDKELPFHPVGLSAQILMFLHNCEGTWATYGTGYYMMSVQQVFPVGTNREVQFRFMRRLQNAGLVSGCSCGCRGDYGLTEAGYEYLEKNSKSGAQIQFNDRVYAP